MLDLMPGGLAAAATVVTPTGDAPVVVLKEGELTLPPMPELEVLSSSGCSGLTGADMGVHTSRFWPGLPVRSSVTNPHVCLRSSFSANTAIDPWLSNPLLPSVNNKQSEKFHKLNKKQPECLQY